jgi:ribosome production factor 2
LKKLRNLLNDFFYMNEKVKGVEIDKLMSVMICWTATEDRKIRMKTYKVEMSGADILSEDGKMSLEALGPNAEFAVRRTKFADTELWKKATYVPKIIKKKENKNIKYDSLGNKRGKIYVDRQNLSNMPTKRKLIAKGEKGQGPKDEVLKERVEN